MSPRDQAFAWMAQAIQRLEGAQEVINLAANTAEGIAVSEALLTLMISNKEVLLYQREMLDERWDVPPTAVAAMDALDAAVEHVLDSPQKLTQRDMLLPPILGL